MQMKLKRNLATVSSTFTLSTFPALTVFCWSEDDMYGFNQPRKQKSIYCPHKMICNDTWYNTSNCCIESTPSRNTAIKFPDPGCRKTDAQLAVMCTQTHSDGQQELEGLESEPCISKQRLVWVFFCFLVFFATCLSFQRSTLHSSDFKQSHASQNNALFFFQLLVLVFKDLHYIQVISNKTMHLKIRLFFFAICFSFQRSTLHSSDF